jgi:hypothetical protein
LPAGTCVACTLVGSCAAQSGDLDDDELEPAVPPGLGQLSASLEGLVEFLRIDPDLVRVAASGSRPAAAPMKPRDVSAWLAKLPVAQKDAFLARVVAGDAAVGSELAQRMGCRGRAPSGLGQRGAPAAKRGGAAEGGRASDPGGPAHRSGKGSQGESRA